MTHRAADSGPPETQSGFTLVEALVAFVIAATALGVLLQSFSGSLNSQRISQDYATASLLAETKLAEAEALLAGNQNLAEGVSGERYNWQVTRRPYAPEDVRFQEGPLAPYELAARVTWSDAGKERSVTLSTMRLERRSE